MKKFLIELKHIWGWVLMHTCINQLTHRYDYTSNFVVQECYILKKSKRDLDAENKLVPNPLYSMYEPFSSPTPYQTGSYTDPLCNSIYVL